MGAVVTAGPAARVTKRAKKSSAIFAAMTRATMSTAPPGAKYLADVEWSMSSERSGAAPQRPRHRSQTTRPLAKS